ncbi:MATE family efflux transporter [Candidatus Contubernalis alkaliaceticus]|uniref:MATE family efflux transporter n=1 Tax=Candidatus Contubernalis alkaliaceticus TaxID=338645 RepID=UPI001F4BD120|nr:MATE family efflux transporter [Candidatus Contubernalis alkalaceticus]UNC90842.1 MATE family efflux transporter [Candidatus Contubernalis alkalaceticus]
MGDYSDYLGTEKITKLLMKMSVPATVAMMVQALYNIVDTIFVGRTVGIMGIAGLTIVFPIQMLILAFAQSIGVSGSSIISRNLGASNINRAHITFTNVLSLVIILSAILILILSLFMIPVLRVFGATGTILPYSKEYLEIIIIGIPFFVFAVAGNNISRAEGNPKVAMNTMLISAGLNTVLDILFIFGFGMGIRGAALATVIAQVSMALYLGYYFFGGKSSLKLKLEKIKIEWNLLREILSLGTSSFARQASASFMIVLINNIIVIYAGDITIAAYGAVNRLVMFAYMPMFGIVQGLQPIVGYNYGSCQFSRVVESVKLSFKTTTAISLFTFLAFMFIPEQLISIFSSDKELNIIGIEALRIISIALPLVGFQLVGAGFYQALGKAVPAFLLATSRQVLFFVPIVLVLPAFFGLKGIWFSFPIADILAFLLTVFLVKGEIKNLNSEFINLKVAKEAVYSDC